MTAQIPPASTASAASYWAPLYIRSWFTFSSQTSDSAPALPALPTDILTRSTPPVTFKWVSLFPDASLEILYTLAPKSRGYSGHRANLRMPSSSSSTPSMRRAEPK